MNRSATYLNLLTSTAPFAVKIPMVMPTDEREIAVALTMCAGVYAPEDRLVRIKNTLRLRRMWVSEALLGEVDGEMLRVVEEPRPMRFDEEGTLL